MSNPLLPSNTHTHESSDIPDFQTTVTNVPAVALMTVHRGLTNNPHLTSAADLVPPLDNVPNVKQNLTATSPPTSLNNQTDDYTVGSRWIDTSSNTEYVCTASNMSSATWVVAHGPSQAQITGIVNEQLAVDINGTTLDLNTDNYIAASNASPIVFSPASTACAVLSSGGAGTNLQFTDATYAAVVSTTGPVTITGMNAVVGACRNAAAAPISISGTGRARAILACVGPQTLSGTGDNIGIVSSDCTDVTTGHEISGSASNSAIMASEGGKISITGSGCFSIGASTATTINGTRVGQLASAGGGTLSGSNSIAVASSGAVTFANNGAGRFVLGCSGTVNITAGSLCGALFCSGNVTISHNNSAIFCAAAALSTSMDNEFRCNEFRTVTGGPVCDPRAKKWMADIEDDPAFLEKFAAIQPIQFRYVHDDPVEPLRVGFSAQEIQASFPHVVQDNFLRRLRCIRNVETGNWECDGQVYNGDFVTVDNEDEPNKGTYRRNLPAASKVVNSMGLVQLVWTACQKNSATIRALRAQLAALQNPPL